MKKPRVLFVDDVEFNLVVMRAHLMQQGYLGYFAKSGNEAILWLHNNEVDAIISDIQMPDGDGIHLIKRVRQLRLTIPFFFYSAAGDAFSGTAVQHGADGFFNKPAEISKLFLKLDEVLKLTKIPPSRAG